MVGSDATLGDGLGEQGFVSFLDRLLKRRNPPMIGLDISSSSVKLVELDQNASGQYVLERLAFQSLEKGWITDGQIERFDEVVEAIKRLIARSGTGTRKVIMGMPQAAVITKKIIHLLVCGKMRWKCRWKLRPINTFLFPWMR
jgi:hypothetical protein